MNLLMLGCGNMGGALLQTWLPIAESTWEELWLLRASQQQQQKIRQHPLYARLRSRLHFAASLAELTQAQRRLRFDHIVLALKPQVIRQQLAHCLALDQDSLWLTIAAGLPLSWYRKHGPNLRLIRMMPNLGAQVGLGAGLLFRPSELRLSPQEEQVLQRLLACCGKNIWCRSEEQLEQATSITGSGPAYFYLLAEILQRELEQIGFGPQESSTLAETTLIGTAQYLQARQSEQNKHKKPEEQTPAEQPPAEQPPDSTSCRPFLDTPAGAVGLAAQLRKAVTSRAGVTEAALGVLQSQLPGIFAQAIAAGTERNRQLQEHR